MRLSRFFEQLGAPMTNVRWSWGAQRATDGAVFLKVWQDRARVEDGRELMLLDRHRDDPKASKNLGYRERVRHIQAVRSGSRCYMVVCVARDVSAHPRSIKEFDDRTLLVGGELVENGGDVWIEVVGRKPTSEVIDEIELPSKSEASSYGCHQNRGFRSTIRTTR